MAQITSPKSRIIFTPPKGHHRSEVLESCDGQWIDIVTDTHLAGSMRLEPFHQDVSIEQPTENIKHILDKLTNVSLPKFVAEVSSYTKDQGAILNKVMHDELTSFRKLTDYVYEERTGDMGDLLMREQASLRDRYDKWYAKMNHRLHSVITRISEIAPNFNWDRYFKNPEEYVTSLFKFDIEQKVKTQDNDKNWRQANMHKLTWIRQQQANTEKENEELTKKLDELRKLHQHRTGNENITIETLTKKKLLLDMQVKNLRKIRDDQGRLIDNLFIQLESRTDKDNIKQYCTPDVAGETSAIVEEIILRPKMPPPDPSPCQQTIRLKPPHQFTRSATKLMPPRTCSAQCGSRTGGYTGSSRLPDPGSRQQTRKPCGPCPTRTTQLRSPAGIPSARGQFDGLKEPSQQQLRSPQLKPSGPSGSRTQPPFSLSGPTQPQGSLRTPSILRTPSPSPISLTPPTQSPSSLRTRSQPKCSSRPPGQQPCSRTPSQHPSSLRPPTKSRGLTQCFRKSRPSTQPEISRTQPEISQTQPEISQTQPEISQTQPQISRTQPESSDFKPSRQSKSPCTQMDCRNLNNVQQQQLRESSDFKSSRGSKSPCTQMDCRNLNNVQQQQQRESSDFKSSRGSKSPCTQMDCRNLNNVQQQQQQQQQPQTKMISRLKPPNDRKQIIKNKIDK